LNLHPFPTRRSSDLGIAKSAEAPVLRVVRRACQACQSLLLRRPGPARMSPLLPEGSYLYGLVLKFQQPSSEQSRLALRQVAAEINRKSTRLNSSHVA